MLELFKQTFLFKGVKDLEIGEILKNIKVFIKKYPKGKMIACRGDKISNLLIVKSGNVQTEMIKVNGSVVKIDELMPRQIIAPAFLFSKNNAYPVDVIAKSDTELIIIPKSNFVELLMTNKQILENFMQAISNKTEHLSKKIWYNVQYRTIKEKVVAYILENQKGNIIEISSIENLASEFSVERPSLSRVIGELVSNNALTRISRNKYEILSVDILHDYLG